MPAPHPKLSPDGSRLPHGIFASYSTDGSVLLGFKLRWREPIGEKRFRQRAETVPVIDGRWRQALGEAIKRLAGAQAIADRGETVAKPGADADLTMDELFVEWVERYAGKNVGERRLREAARLWGRDVSPMKVGERGERTFGDLLVREIVERPAWLVAYQDALDAAGQGDATRRKILFLIRGVLRRGRRWHPDLLVQNPAVDMFDMPTAKRRRLVRAADLLTVHRIREQILLRPARDPLAPFVEAVFVTAMAEAIAVRPSELLKSARWADLYERTLWIQRDEDDFDEDDLETGLKTGPRAALLLPTLREDLIELREHIEDRFGPQPEHGLIFQKLGRGGPQWTDDGDPIARSLNDYKRFTARVYRPARATAALASDVPDWVARMPLKDLRHAAISLALHSRMAQHELCEHSGHSEKTLNDVYRHIIKEYEGRSGIDMADEARLARARVAEKPHRPVRTAGPQQAQQRRRRERHHVTPSNAGT